MIKFICEFHLTNENKFKQMKNIRLYVWFLVVSMALITVACDDEEDDSTPVFPELQQLDCNVGDEQTLTFIANDDWTLTSSALWCSFMVDGEQVYSCSGEAGNVSVSLHISNDASVILKDYKADVSLFMGGMQSVICKVMRPQTGFVLSAFNQDQSTSYTTENPFILDYEGLQYMTITSNTDWVLESSDNFDFTATNSYGVAGEEVTIQPLLAEGMEYRKNAWDKDLVFKNRDDEVIAQVPVHYDGIPADKIEFSNKNAIGNRINYSYDGGEYTLSDEQYPAPMSIECAARNDQYTVVYVDFTEELNDWTWEYEYTCTKMNEADSWIFVDDDTNGGLQVYASSNSGDVRSAFLMVFPNQVYQQIESDFENIVFSTEEGIVSDYNQYVAGTFTQDANPSLTSGFVLTDMQGSPLYDAYGSPIELYNYMDAIGDLTEAEMIETYGTTNVYILALPLGVSYEYIIAKPKGFTGYYIQPMAFNPWPNVEVSMYSMLEAIIMGIGTDTNGSDMMGVNFIDPDGLTYGVLLITRY